MKTVFFIFSLIPGVLWAQVHIDFQNDSLESEQVPEGRWNTHWEGAIPGDYSLHHVFDNNESGCDYFIIRLDPLKRSDSLVISFRVRHGYNPSASNNWQVALLADFCVETEELDGSFEKPEMITEGLMIGINLDGSDDLVKLWECREGICRVRSVTSLNYQEQVGTDRAAGFRLEWRQGGDGSIFYTPVPEKHPEDLIGSFRLDSLPGGRYLLVRYQYSPSQDQQLWIDDIRMDGNFVKDTCKPVVTGLEVPDDRHLLIHFSERVAVPPVTSFQLSGPTLGSISPDHIGKAEGGLLLEFAAIIPNREQLQLRLNGVCDLDANCLLDTVISCLRNEARWGDVVINELLVDPSPAVLLPEEEFIEIYNRSVYGLDLTGWWILVNQQRHQLAESSVKLASGRKGTGLLLEAQSFAVITGIPLPNEGALVTLNSAQGVIIHSAAYATPWKGPDWKKEGGWSLESPDPEQVCNVSRLWEFSKNPGGGSPGITNSNYTMVADQDPPVFLYLGFGNQPGTVVLHYSEPVCFEPGDLEQMVLKPGNVLPDRISAGWPPSHAHIFRFPFNLPDRNEFTIQLPAVADCAGNHSRPLEVRAGSPSGIQPGSLLINEIMVDPVEGAPEYIELYHPGSQYFDLREFSLGISGSGTSGMSLVALSDHSRIISPGQFLVLAKNIEHLMDAYNLEPQGQWVEVKEMKSLDNSEGTIILTDRNGMVVDRVGYSDQMHAEVVDVTRGVSLERISHSRPGSLQDNWHSAASIEGYATPGRINSQSEGAPDFSQLISVEPEVFSPDNDGYQDLLKISISPGNQGWVLSIWISDLNGRVVRILANNHLAGPSVSYAWNGKRDDGIPVMEGIYAIHIKGYHPSTGEKWTKSKAFGVIYR